MRVPLIISYFATEDRINALKSQQLRELLDSVVFEPYRYLPKNAALCPEEVPTKNEQALNTPYGLLINELTRSPTQTVNSMIRLLVLALGLDTGSYFASQSDIILYVLRLGCRIENFMSLVLAYAEGKAHPSLRLRDTTIDPVIVDFLREKRQEIRRLLETRFQVGGREGGAVSRDLDPASD